MNACLAKKFDNRHQTKDFHREWWKLCLSDARYVAIAAPRAHSKSTSITHSYLLACLLFRQAKYALIVSDTETQASMFLGDIRNELIENEDIIHLFGVKKFTKVTETDLIVEMSDGYRFRIMAKGAEQKLRGVKWDGMRPDLVICHEKDTEVYTPETGWIKNQDYPGAKLIHAHEAFEVEFENGVKERVSGEHRYLMEDGSWKFAWELKKNDNVKSAENITDATMNDILNAEKSPSQDQITNAKTLLNDGLPKTPSVIKLLNTSIIWKTKIDTMLKQRNTLETMRPGKRQRALLEEHVKCKQRLVGLTLNLCKLFMKNAKQEVKVLEVN